MIIGITGSIGSGKSTVSKIFEKYGFTVIDADEISHRIIEKKPIKKILTNNFGNMILNKKGEINRKELGKIAFGDKNKLKKLNSIVHPLIIGEIKKRVGKLENKNIVIDAPLLLETDAKKLVDKIIVVKTYSENIIKRNKRFSTEQLEKILNFQMPLDKKIKHANFVIDNNGNLESLEKQVKEILESLKQ